MCLLTYQIISFDKGIIDVTETCLIPIHIYIYLIHIFQKYSSCGDTGILYHCIHISPFVAFITEEKTYNVSEKEF